MFTRFYTSVTRLLSYKQPIAAPKRETEIHKSHKRSCNPKCTCERPCLLYELCNCLRPLYSLPRQLRLTRFRAFYIMVVNKFRLVDINLFVLAVVRRA